MNITMREHGPPIVYRSIVRYARGSHSAQISFVGELIKPEILEHLKRGSIFRKMRWKDMTRRNIKPVAAINYHIE